MKVASERSSQSSQQGWVLVIGLMVLVMLTIIAMALMRTTLLEEKMAGASRDINLSFEAAESGLRAIENFITSQPNDYWFNPEKEGFYGEEVESSEPHPFKETWTDTNSAKISSLDTSWTRPEGVTLTPRYMIKKISEQTSGEINMSGYGETDLTTKTVIFRITVRGTGGNNSTQTVLQGHYAATY